MSNLLTPRKKRVLTENNADSYTESTPYAQTPTSHKKMSRYEDILYISKSELEKEVKAFFTFLTNRKVIKESEVSSYLEYLKKGIFNIAVDTSQIDNIENFSDASRSPGHKRNASSATKAVDHHLKLRNFQLERDRVAYEEKLMNHGKYIADLEEKISKLIEEYKGVFEEKSSLEAELENVTKQFEISKNLNAALKTNNEGISKKNNSMRQEIDNLMKKVAELQNTNSPSHDKVELQEKILILEQELRIKEEDYTTRAGLFESQIKEIETQVKEEKGKKIVSLEETIKKDADLRQRNKTMQKKVAELEEQITLDAGLKMKVAAFQQQIKVLEEHIKSDAGLRQENESQQKKIAELEEHIKNNCTEKKENENRKEPVTPTKTTEEQTKKSADLIREIKNLKGQIAELKEQAKKDVKLRSDFLDMQKLIVELETSMKASSNQKKEVEVLQKRVVELEVQTKRDSELKKNMEVQQQRIIELEAKAKRETDLIETVKFLQGRVFELEGQIEHEKIENDKIDRYAKVLEDMERVRKENEKLADQLTEREVDVKMLESQKEKLLKEIGGLIDNIRKENEEGAEESNEKLAYNNERLAQEIQEKDQIIQLLRAEAEKFMQEAQNYQRLLKEAKAEQITKANQNRGAEQPAQQSQIQNAKPELRQIPSIKISMVPSTASPTSILLLENFEGQGTERMQESDDRILSRVDQLQSADISQLYGSMTYDHIRKQLEDYRTTNVLLQKKVENYYLQIEELNSVLKVTNENLDAAQNRCITLQRELQNKCNLEVLVQSLLNLINNLELKIERLVDENISLQKVSQDNIVTITGLKNELEDEIKNNSAPHSPISPHVKKGMEEALTSRYRRQSDLEKETLIRDYEGKIKRILDEKEIEFEEEQIRNKNHTERYNAHLEVLGRKVQALVAVNEGLGRDLEVLKVEFSDYKIVVASILKETSKAMEGFQNYDTEMENIIQGILEESSRNTDVFRLKEFYGMLKRDIVEAIKQLEERKALI